MENTFTRAEHEEFRRYVESETKRLEEENGRQNHRLTALEQAVNQISQLAANTEKLAVNMENMLKVQERQGSRLETLEARDGETWRKVVWYVVAGALGLVGGLFLKQIGL